MEDDIFYTIVLWEKKTGLYSTKNKYVTTLPYRFESYKAVTTMRDFLNENVGNRFIHVIGTSGKQEFDETDESE